MFDPALTEVYGEIRATPGLFASNKYFLSTSVCLILSQTLWGIQKYRFCPRRGKTKRSNGQANNTKQCEELYGEEH